jgi:Aspartyl/Asparaginyl beta-hydroxylase
MLTKTGITIDLKLLTDAVNAIPSEKLRLSINEPTGDFFYDPWIIKEEFKETVWERIINSLEFPIGEARIIILKEGTCYQSHADIDDRYHLNISGNDSYLINLEEKQMYPFEADGMWYLMDAGKKHTAANFGRGDRVQLVVRQLLTKINNDDLISVEVQATGDHIRQKFDNTISPWLNKTNKIKMISDFAITSTGVRFKTYQSILPLLESIMPTEFKIIL